MACRSTSTSAHRLFIFTNNDHSQPGMEETTATRLAARLLQMQDPPPIASIIGRASLPGCVILESSELKDVFNACTGINNVLLNSIFPIEQVDASRYLKEPPSFQLHEGAWIRLKQKPYRSDLAYVLSVNERTLAFEALVVPRMDFTASENKRQRSRGSVRPPKALFDESIAAHYQGTQAVSRRNQVVVFKEQHIFVEGLLQLSDPPYSAQEVAPTREEVLWFQGCSRVEKGSIQQALATADASELKTGDVVKIVAGQSQGLRGTIMMVRAFEADVSLAGLGQTEAVPLSFLRKRLVVGDEAVITDGMEVGFRGWVVALWKDDVFMYSNAENREVSPIRRPVSDILLTFCRL